MLQPTESVKLSTEVLSSVQSKLASLEQALLAKDPQMPVHLREMHRLLTSYPESVHLLEDSEIKTVLAAAQEWTQTKIVTEKPRATGTKKKVAVDDL